MDMEGSHLRRPKRRVVIRTRALRTPAGHVLRLIRVKSAKFERRALLYAGMPVRSGANGHVLLLPRAFLIFSFLFAKRCMDGFLRGDGRMVNLAVSCFVWFCLFRDVFFIEKFSFLEIWLNFFNCMYFYSWLIFNT